MHKIVKVNFSWYVEFIKTILDTGIKCVTTLLLFLCLSSMLFIFDYFLLKCWWAATHCCNSVAAAELNSRSPSLCVAKELQKWIPMQGHKRCSVNGDTSVFFLFFLFGLTHIISTLLVNEYYQNLNLPHIHYQSDISQSVVTATKMEWVCIFKQSLLCLNLVRESVCSRSQCAGIYSLACAIDVKGTRTVWMMFLIEWPWEMEGVGGNLQGRSL